ncbi:hypothetical protein LCGC14_2635030 [marine sediment metagenome]|uniref:Uncharacterized protein n=1 Tax=marine sediment metagenome TaxID=412755 RepID=A0A0F9ALN8_9ZZZZ
MHKDGKKKKKRGPKEERLELEGSYEGAVKKAILKPRPKAAWPK